MGEDDEGGVSQWVDLADDLARQGVERVSSAGEEMDQARKKYEEAARLAKDRSFGPENTDQKDREYDRLLFEMLVRKGALVEDEKATHSFQHRQAFNGETETVPPQLPLLDEDEVVYRVNGARGVKLMTKLWLTSSRLMDAVRRGAKTEDREVAFDFIADEAGKGLDDPEAAFYRRRLHTLGEVTAGQVKKQLYTRSSRSELVRDVPEDKNIYWFWFQPNRTGVVFEEDEGRVVSYQRVEPRRGLRGYGFTDTASLVDIRETFAVSLDAKNVWIVGQKDWVDKRGLVQRFRDALTET